MGLEGRLPWSPGAAGAQGGPSAVVNNAGIASRGHTVADTDPEELRRVVGVHAVEGGAGR